MQFLVFRYALENGEDKKMEEEKSQQQIRGFYSRIHISVKTLDILILVLSFLLVICMAFGISKRGYQVTFDSLGGTMVESQKQMYGEYLEEPEVPTREGYVFNGWYRDSALTIPWDIEEDIVTESITLYAEWKEH